MLTHRPAVGSGISGSDLVIYETGHPAGAMRSMVQREDQSFARHMGENDLCARSAETKWQVVCYSIGEYPIVC